jgi:hypothetical protein
MCRKSGLDVRRRCGWLDRAADQPSRIVWCRKSVALDTCPKSYVTAESEAMVEEFLVRRRLGGIQIAELSARQVEAYLILEQALVSEIQDSGSDTRRAVRHD